MTRTEELMALAEAAIGDYVPVVGVSLEMLAFQWKTTPETIKQLVALCRLQNEALKEALGHVEYNGPDDEIGGHCCCNSLSYAPHEPDCAVNNAIAAFNKFEGGE